MRPTIDNCPPLHRLARRRADAGAGGNEAVSRAKRPSWIPARVRTVDCRSDTSPAVGGAVSDTSGALALCAAIRARERRWKGGGDGKDSTSPSRTDERCRQNAQCRWMGGCPSGFCDQPVYGERPPSRQWQNAWSGEWHREDGKYNGYIPGLACEAHGGPPPRHFGDPVWLAIRRTTMCRPVRARGQSHDH